MNQYRHIIGSLMYLTNTRPDICFVGNILNQYLVKPIRVHLIDAKHVMRYLKGMINMGPYMGEIMTTICMGIRIRIGKEVPQTEREPQVDVIVSDPP